MTGAPDSGSLPDRIVLVGFMAAGKTAVGRRVAERIGYRFVDLDREVERRAGRTVPEIFRLRGEEGFRELEAETTRALDDERGVVVAAGGGWMAREELRNRWRDQARVWLQVTPEAVMERLEGDLESRPMLDPDAPLASIRRLLRDREADYALAEYSVDTVGRGPDEVAERVVAKMTAGTP